MKRLVNLILQNKDNPARAIRAEANTIYFYDVIGYEEEGNGRDWKQIRENVRRHYIADQFARRRCFCSASDCQRIA